MLTAPLPAALNEALAWRVDSAVARADVSADLTRRYRDTEQSPGPVARTWDEVLAYAAARLPATYAAVRVSLGELASRMPSFAPASQLDLGAGPGTALWAAAELWPSPRQVVAVEAVPEMARLGGELGDAGWEWRLGTVPDAVPRERSDLVTLAYLLGELDEAQRAPTLERAWQASRQALVVVEPGTPAGYERVIAARDLLLARGGTVVAPCPHDRSCPLLGSGDWCHFAVRVARSGAHRRAKQAQLGHEDEKFSYVVMARTPARQAGARVLRHPQLRPGHVILELCAADGLRREVVSKRERERYRRARRIAWGQDLEAP